MHGGIGTDLKTGLTIDLDNATAEKKDPVSPIYAASSLSATDPDSPFSWAMFTIVQDAIKGLRLDSMKISMYECHGGPLRVSTNSELKSLEQIPSREHAAKLINDKWKFIHSLKTGKQHIDSAANTVGIRRREL